MYITKKYFHMNKTFNENTVRSLILGEHLQNSTLYIQFINFPPINKKASTLRTYEVLALII